MQNRKYLQQLHPYCNMTSHGGMNLDEKVIFPEGQTWLSCSLVSFKRRHFRKIVTHTSAETDQLLLQIFSRPNIEVISLRKTVW